MATLQRSLVALLLLIAGMAAALPFHRAQSPEVPLNTRHAQDSRVRWRTPNLILQIPDHDEQSPAAELMGSSVFTPLTTPAEPSHMDETPVVPELTSVFRSFDSQSSVPEDPRPPLLPLPDPLRATDASIVETEERAPSDVEITSTPLVPVTASPSVASAYQAERSSKHNWKVSRELPPVVKEHRVVDGDTLPALAARYLGDAKRWPEILDANRDQLAHPEILPLGSVLRVRLVPPRTTVPSVQSKTNAVPAGHPKRSGLVPYRNAPSS